jgi:hypothetical protein
MDYVEHQGLSVVLVGSFNPAIFNPDWLAKQGIISEHEASDARIDVIHPEVTQFVVGDFQFDISRERFMLVAVAEPFVRVSDVVAELFREKLAHTPLTALGINYHAHFRVRDWKQQTALGRKLAPIEPWGDWGAALTGDDLRTVGGLVSLTMQQSAPDDRLAGNIKVTVQPSATIEPGNGVYVQVNDHYERPVDGTSVNFAEVCLKQITPSLERSRARVTHLSNLARSL